MGGVAATSLLARRPRPKPHTAAEKHPHRDAQGQSRTVPDAAMSLVKPDTLSATSRSPLHSRKNTALTPQTEEDRLGPCRRGPPEPSPPGSATAPTMERAGRTSAGAGPDRGPLVPHRGPSGPDRGPPGPKPGRIAGGRPATPSAAAQGHEPHRPVLRRDRRRHATAIAAGPSTQAPRAAPPPTAPASRRTTARG
nr:uncharacterized protein LOC127310162 [Lolium perenne]